MGIFLCVCFFCVNWGIIVGCSCGCFGLCVFCVCLWVSCVCVFGVFLYWAVGGTVGRPGGWAVIFCVFFVGCGLTRWLGRGGLTPQAGL